MFTSTSFCIISPTRGWMKYLIASRPIPQDNLKPELELISLLKPVFICYPLKTNTDSLKSNHLLLLRLSSIQQFKLPHLPYILVELTI